MTIKLSLKSGILFVTAFLLLVAGVAYAVSSISRGVEGFVRVTASITGDKALALYTDVNGQTGDRLTLVDFGTVDVDPFGNPSQASRVRVWVQNGSNTTYKLAVDDQDPINTGDDTFAIGEVLFARSGDALSTMPTTDIVLETGDLVAIDLGLKFTSVVTGDHTFTVRFRAEKADGAVGWYFASVVVTPLNDPRVRMAIDYAINEAAIRSDFFFLPNWPSLEGSIQSFDPETAKRLLAEAGYVDGFSGLCIDPVDSKNVGIANEMVSQLAGLGLAAIVGGSCDRRLVVIDINL